MRSVAKKANNMSKEVKKVSRVTVDSPTPETTAAYSESSTPFNIYT
jgi:hypothetical protein